MARYRGPGAFRPPVEDRISYSAPSRTLRSKMLPEYRHLLVAFGILTLLIATSTGFSSMLWAQVTGDDVHISPRVVPVQPKANEIIDPALKTHTKPLKVDVDLVLVPVTITDPMNRLVTGLDKDNFSLFEGKEAQEIRHFSSEDAPVSLGVIFDMSGSMSSKIERAREAVMEFFKTANPQDEFFMITFADKPEEISDFTQSVEDIQGKLVYTIPKGRTALLDAIYLGVSKMRQAKFHEEVASNHLRRRR